MTHNEATRYWFPARKNLINLKVIKSDGSTSGSKGLAALLGYPYTKSGDFRTIELTEKLITQLRMLNGPNARTVLKIIKVRQDERI